jgi:hypothetical protein
MEEKQPKIIKVAQIPKTPQRKTTTDELLATLCYYYPQYTFAEARRLPYKRLLLLLRVARRIESIKMGNLVQIVAAPHFGKGKGVKELAKYFEKMANQ